MSDIDPSSALRAPSPRAAGRRTLDEEVAIECPSPRVSGERVAEGRVRGFHCVVEAFPERSQVLTAPRWIRIALTATALLFLALLLFAPLAALFVEALRRGVAVYAAAIADTDAQAAIRLTLLTAAITVPLNTIFGVAAAWAITRFDFRGKSVLVTLIDLPFAVSPVVSGLLFIQLFGARGLIGGWLRDHGLRVIFAAPGIVLATIFVTFPFVARELIAFMETQGREQEEAAVVLGASGWQTFFRVTLPNIKWGLLYGVILCNSRAMGEFGAVSVVSGHIRGQTNTIPLHVEVLYNEYQLAGAFAVASLLMLLALITLALKLPLPAARGEGGRRPGEGFRGEPLIRPLGTFSPRGGEKDSQTSDPFIGGKA
jgi:sulfate transport system permease protein